MRRKGFQAVPTMRGLGAVPAGSKQAAYQRAGYVEALRRANSGDYGPG
jgi:dihydroorotate dehydrogenase (fumarate)